MIFITNIDGNVNYSTDYLKWRKDEICHWLWIYDGISWTIKETQKENSKQF